MGRKRAIISSILMTKMFGKAVVLKAEALGELVWNKGSTCAFNCWFARDVTAAMLVVKNKSISLLWELNSIFM